VTLHIGTLKTNSVRMDRQDITKSSYGRCQGQ